MDTPYGYGNHSRFHTRIYSSNHRGAERPRSHAAVRSVNQLNDDHLIILVLVAVKPSLSLAT
jgi:hypothetical protein